MIIHISGFPGSGKTTLGDKLQKMFGNKIVVYDTDGFLQHHNKEGRQLLKLESDINNNYILYYTNPNQFNSYYIRINFINEIYNDRGAYLKDGIECLKLYGLCEEKLWNYSIENLFIKPSYEAYKNAKKNYLIEAFNISKDLKVIKYWLLKNEPIAIAIGIFSNFLDIQVSKTGIVNLPDFNNDKFLGGHAVVICGFDDNKQRFILRNSWGNYWGDNGYFYLPYDYIINDNPNLCGNDFWIITKSKFNY